MYRNIVSIYQKLLKKNNRVIKQIIIDKTEEIENKYDID